ncbi:hypothetical protein C8F01DRAFT_1232204 [Mycena amicta]|nr:hypothetical protein C8F01DRAFT_1232204 [Mycena amicta]
MPPITVAMPLPKEGRQTGAGSRLAELAVRHDHPALSHRLHLHLHLHPLQHNATQRHPLSYVTSVHLDGCGQDPDTSGCAPDMLQNTLASSIALASRQRNSPWTLSRECLYGEDSETALLAYLSSDPTLADEIHKCCGAAKLDRILTNSEREGEEEAQANRRRDDDADVPLEQVIQAALDSDAADREYRQASDADGLESANNLEDITAYEE